MTLINKGFKRIIAILLLVSLFAGSTSFSYGETKRKGITRLSGKNRYETALLVADELKEELGVSKFDNIVVATGTAYPDALSGTYLATAKKAPILLVSNGDNSRVISYIRKNLKSGGTIYILGGSGAVSTGVEQSLSAVSKTVRLSGNGRYATNLEILKEAAPKAQDLLICSGKDFADALSASAVGSPILLVGDSLTSDQEEYIKTNLPNIKNIYLIGGKGAVSEEVENQILKLKYARRISGDNRYSTSVAIAKKFYGTSKKMVMATGSNFPDGLAGGVLARAQKAPLILSTNGYKFMYGYLHSVKKASPNKVTVLGGESLVSDDGTGLKKNGGKKYGLLKIGNELYYSYEDGSIAKNRFVDIDGKRYYATSEWKLAKNQMITHNGKTYGATADGSLAKNGWYKCGKLKYLFNNDYSVNETCLKAERVLKKVDYDLRGAFDYAVEWKYYTFDSKISWGSVWFANFGFEKEMGDCLIRSGAFFIMAKMLGYDARHVYGTIGSQRQEHAWVEIDQEDTTYVYDLDYADTGKYWHSGWKFHYGDDGTWLYNRPFENIPLQYIP